jgi:predicted CoA-binding protein
MEVEKSKITLIAGATSNPSRYAFTAATFLDSMNLPFIPIGIKKGSVLGKEIKSLQEKPKLQDIDTITLYLNAGHQKEWEDYFLSLKPKRIIFNPGAENPQFYQKAKLQGIDCVNGCTLVMISTGQY